MAEQSDAAAGGSRQIIGASVASVLADARRGHAGLFWFAASMAVLAVAAAVGVAVDPRELLGAPIWLKPLKFALSFGLYSLTLAWMLSLLPHRRRLVTTAVGWLVVAGSAVEVGIIAVQAARGHRSHFNEDTPLDGLLFSIMGATVALLWLATVVLALVITRRRSADPATMSAIRLGLLIGLVGMGLGALMVIQPGGGAHSVGVPDGGPGLPLFGWSTLGGDLRVGHFVGMHALQLLPLLAAVLAAVSRGRLGDDARRSIVRIAATGYLGLVALFTWQALRGQPLLAPDAVTLTALAALVVACFAAMALAVGRRPSVVAR
jgi:hypothetical protein